MADRVGAALDPFRRRGWWPYGLVLVLVVALGGCGISATGKPVDEGNAVSSGDFSLDAKVDPPPSENEAGTAVKQVENFLMAAAGGLASATEQVKRYLTPAAREAWKEPVPPDNPPLTVVRLLGDPSTGAAVGQRTPVTVRYQVVGTMTGGLGRMDNDLADPASQQMTFWVVGEGAGLRIDEIDGAPSGLLLSDAAIDALYRIQPIYFWDKTYGALVPDVRYLPRTVTLDKRYSLLVNGLVAGPSPWLSGAVQRLPAGLAATDVVTGTDGTLQVRLSAQPGDREALRRLKFQLQWTLAADNPSQRIELLVDEKPVPVEAADTEYLQYNLGFTHDTVSYDIVNQKIEALGATAPVLTAAENAGVVAAAIGQQGTVAALVRLDSANRRYLQFVRAGVGRHVEAQVSHTSGLGRPAFVPNTDFVLVSTGGTSGHLLAVSIVDGSASNALRTVDGITAMSVSPDGRRVAFIAAGQVYVSSLIIENNAVTVGSTPRPILPSQSDLAAVTWTSESELKVGGPTAIWRVTADGVVAENQSDRLGGLRVLDLVCNPGWTHGQVDVYAATQLGVYSFRIVFAPTSLHAPFFGH